MRKMLQQTLMAVMAVWALSMIQSQMGSSSSGMLLASSAHWAAR
ncbi:hypothetical protein WNB94_05060 [Aquabacterium sp. A3]